MTADLIVAIDQGTTSSRGVIVDADGQFVHVAQREIPQQYLQPGWVNQRAEDLIDITIDVTRAVIDRLGDDADRLAAIGITNQRETTVLWDRQTGEPVAPAIVWQSRQSAGIVADLVKRGLRDQIQAETGLVPDAYFSATKIAWLLEHDAGLRRRANDGEICFGTVDSWLIWHLTGGKRHVTDISNASRTMVFDIHRGAWSDDLLAELRIPAAMLPEVVSNVGDFGTADARWFGRELPIRGSAGDQQSALFGQACFASGQAKNTYGTGSFLLMQTGQEPMTSTHDLLTTVAWEMRGTRSFALEGAVFVTGSAVQWLRDGLGMIESAADIEALAASVEDTGGVAFVPALSGLGAPWWDAEARGTMTGITRGTTAAHIARATLEAIAMQSRDVLTCMEQDSGIALEELRVDGGASANDLLMQMQADVLGVPVIRPANIETTVLGAAYLAGIGSGVWAGQDDVRASWSIDRRFEPHISESERADRIALWQDAVGRARSVRQEYAGK